RDESPKALTDEIQKNGSLTYDLHLFSANQKNSHKVLTDSKIIACLTDEYSLMKKTKIFGKRNTCKLKVISMLC
ncbi:hypothetical protein, partial [Bacillus smithii]|uniref:hypothetical protein n=1 Tax=Bacillus smithii TaxID=1479 RepID=UPI002E1A5A05|nr:hypothetical protein [Bacillus smithii]